MRILAWHADPTWMSAFVQGPHEIFVPVLQERGPFGRGCPESGWPESAIEIHPRELAQLDVDVVVLQRPPELGLATTWLGRKPGIDIDRSRRTDEDGGSVHRKRWLHRKRDDLGPTGEHNGNERRQSATETGYLQPLVGAHFGCRR